MTFYTDYPIPELGDKYCVIEAHNVETSINAGYVYIDENKTQISKNFLKIFT